ncbi:hypothetical protein ACRS8P_37375 [Burkholderia cenocepacia]
MTAVNRCSRPVVQLSVIKRGFERTVFLLIEEVISIHPADMQWVFLSACAQRAVRKWMRMCALSRIAQRCGIRAMLRPAPADHILVDPYDG